MRAEGGGAGLRWARWTSRRRREILALSVLVGAVAAPVAAHLPLYGDLSYLLPPGTQSVRDLHALESRAQVFGTVIVAVESDDSDPAAGGGRAGPRSPARAAARSAHRRRLRQRRARRVRLGAPLSAGAERRADAACATSWRRERRGSTHFTCRWTTMPATADAPPIGDRLRGAQAADGRGARGGRAPGADPLGRRAAAAGGGADALPGRRDLAQRRRRRGGRRAPPPRRAGWAARRVRIGITGDVANAAQEHQALLGGMVRATIFTTAIVALGLLLFFGAAAPVGALLGALTVGALVTFAFAFFSIGHLNLATAFLAPIVVGNGINFGIILLGALLRGAEARGRPGRRPRGGGAGELRRDAGGGADGVGVVRVAADDAVPRLPPLRRDRGRRDPLLLGGDLLDPARRAGGAGAARSRRRPVAGTVGTCGWRRWFRAGGRSSSG